MSNDAATRYGKMIVAVSEANPLGRSHAAYDAGNYDEAQHWSSVALLDDCTEENAAEHLRDKWGRALTAADRNDDRYWEVCVQFYVHELRDLGAAHLIAGI